MGHPGSLSLLPDDAGAEGTWGMSPSSGDALVGAGTWDMGMHLPLSTCWWLGGGCCCCHCHC